MMKKALYILLAVFLAAYLSYKVLRVFSQSLFMQKKDRINIAMYGPQSGLYSIDTNENRHYVLYFPPDLKMQVPGGYGNYRVGSLGKLAKLDENPDIYRKTFALATTAFVDYYFYQDSSDVYYGNETKDKVTEPALYQFITYPGNANIFDRVFLLFTFLRINQSDFTVIDYLEKTNKAKNDVVFQDESFKKESIGLLFQKKYRTEHKSIQILYKDGYLVAAQIASLLEGNGIRVNDISINLSDKKKCSVVEDLKVGQTFSRTASDVASYFDCALVIGKTDVYDIIFVLGNIEKDWEVL